MLGRVSRDKSLPGISRACRLLGVAGKGNMYAIIVVSEIGIGRCPGTRTRHRHGLAVKSDSRIPQMPAPMTHASQECEVVWPGLCPQKKEGFRRGGGERWGWSRLPS
ncbi:hypothetical protein J6590_004415 [Homalodisca vitripennis]|nr:hypothetical protein J6590_004415 [Homalodisca vitripennis]